jgi:hypothetical protein
MQLITEPHQRCSECGQEHLTLLRFERSSVLCQECLDKAACLLADASGEE